MAKMTARIEIVLRKQKRFALSIKEIAKQAGVKKSEKQVFEQAMQQLRDENRILERDGKYWLTANLNLVQGVIVKVTETFGFAKPDVGDHDLFVPGRMLRGTMPGDVVLLRQMRGKGEHLPEGEVMKVIEAVNKPFTGVLTLNETDCFVQPDRYVRFPLRVNRQRLNGAKDGDKVLAEVVRNGERQSAYMANILEAFGNAQSAQACCRSILAANGIEDAFPDEVLELAQVIGGSVGIHPKEEAVRLDLRDKTIFTIDGADTKDIDDAISLEKQGSGWKLGVHIADVSYYVTHQSPLDKEAFHRGTSVYYADSVIPMLPKELSNGICSLNPNEDRLAFSALIDLDAEGKMIGYRFEKTIIRSRVKGVYSEVNAILGGTADEAVREKYKDLEPVICHMCGLAEILERNRFGRGGMDIDSVESKIIVGEDGRAVDVVARTRGVSERIIEEFMLVANEAAATFAQEKVLPFVYRVHENPAPDRLENLYAVLEKLGVTFLRPKDGVKAAHLAEILNKVKGSEIAPVVNTMVLRSMAKARYSERETGHFGLALDNYAHFTSPIRRYPDLTIHRIMSAYVTHMRPDNINKRYTAFAVESAARSTEREVAAMTAERDCESCYKAEFMQKFIGQEFFGMISSVTQFGVYVQLENTVEGLVSIRSFPEGEQWSFDGTITLVEQISGRQLRFGDPVRVKLIGTDISAGQIDFELVKSLKE